MFKFFRRVRQSLLSEDKFKKYLLYALGEIFLVVIGILIALQVSNWNENRIIQQSAKYHLSLLSQDLKQDELLLLNLKQAFEADFKRTERLLDIMKGLEESTDKIPEDVIRLLLEYNFKPRNSALDVLVNSGEIGALDLEAQNLISQYYRSVDTVEERDAITNSFIQNKYEPHIYQHLNYIWGFGNTYPTLEDIYKDDTRDPISYDIDKFLSDKILEVLIVARYYQIEKLIEVYEISLQNLEKLQHHISK